MCVCVCGTPCARSVTQNGSLMCVSGGSLGGLRQAFTMAPTCHKETKLFLFQTLTFQGKMVPSTGSLFWKRELALFSPFFT